MKNSLQAFKKCFAFLIIYIFAACAFTTDMNAQVEIKINPLALIFETVHLSIEKPIGDTWGMEGETVFGGGVFLFGLNGKAYLKPKYGADRFHIGLFAAGGSGLGVGAGFFTGYKILSKQGIILELALGIGRGTESFIPYGKLHFGYRLKHGIEKKVKQEVID